MVHLIDWTRFGKTYTCLCKVRGKTSHKRNTSKTQRQNCIQGQILRADLIGIHQSEMKSGKTKILPKICLSNQTEQLGENSLSKRYDLEGRNYHDVTA